MLVSYHYRFKYHINIYLLYWTTIINLSSCDQITISVNCTGLQSVNLERYHQLSDASIISISENCTGLNELNISHNNITYTSLIVIAKNCTVLQSLKIYDCNSPMIAPRSIACITHCSSYCSQIQRSYHSSLHQ